MATHQDYLRTTTDTTQWPSAMVTTRERVLRRGDVVEWQPQLDGAEPAGECLVNPGHERDLHSGAGMTLATPKGRQ